VKPLKYKMLNL